MFIEFQSVSTEYVKTDKGGYSKATVEYVDEGGRNKKQYLVSYSNPAVYEVFTNAKAGQTYDVTTKENGKFVNWAAAKLVASDAAPKTSAPAAKGEYTSQYETRDERNARQRLIVRQSSLTNAVAILSAGAKAPPKTGDVLDLANELVAFVYEAPSLIDEMDDIPL